MISTHLKNMIVKMGLFPNLGVNIKNIVETTTWDMFVLPTIQFSGKMLVFQWELNNENGAERGVKHSCRFKMKLKNQPLEKNSFSILASISHFGGIQKLQELSISFTAIKQKWWHENTSTSGGCFIAMLAYRRVSIGMETNIALFNLFCLAMRLPLQDIASCCFNPSKETRGNKTNKTTA